MPARIYGTGVCACSFASVGHPRPGVNLILAATPIWRMVYLAEIGAAPIRLTLRKRL